ncbi:DUF6462 family protein [Lachnotalea sp. AF33-28]|uniref:DUF6462 family protein n=1 Tax=Lachnotalea sp. AF33-28 TaxID=2292046 RepID=UPI001FAA5BC2|nr:DUF6462 family protein [Lachnotalea sp. AF33-28]
MICEKVQRDCAGSSSCIAEIVYSITHKKLLELAGIAAIYQMDGTVLSNRDIFDEYLESFMSRVRWLHRRIK